MLVFCGSESSQLWTLHPWEKNQLNVIFWHWNTHAALYGLPSLAISTIISKPRQVPQIGKKSPAKFACRVELGWKCKKYYRKPLLPSWRKRCWHPHIQNGRWKWRRQESANHLFPKTPENTSCLTKKLELVQLVIMTLCWTTSWKYSVRSSLSSIEIMMGTTWAPAASNHFT